VVALLGLGYAGLGMNVIDAISEDHAVAMQELKDRLPPQARLVSLGVVDHVFTFHYRDPIRVLAQSQGEHERPEADAYFVFDPDSKAGPKPDFAWEQVAVFSCDRLRHDVPQRPVVVGRRLVETAAVADPALHR
jgi:hypothetical protein